MPVIRRERWEISRLNEALKFLKYEAGDYFRPHSDAHYVDKETGETSYLTAHFYLNGGSDREAGVEGWGYTVCCQVRRVGREEGRRRSENGQRADFPAAGSISRGCRCDQGDEIHHEGRRHV